MTVSKSLSNLSRWPLFISYSLFLYIGFTLPSDQVPELMLQANDKLLHFLDFLVLALLAFRTFTFSSQSLFYLHAGTKAAGFSVFYGSLLEWSQRTVPGRNASLWDWVADLAGILVASGIFRISRLTPSS